MYQSKPTLGGISLMILKTFGDMGWKGAQDGVRGEFLRWKPLPKGTLFPGLEQFALHFGIHSGISFDMVFIDRHLLWGGFVEGVGPIWGRGKFLRCSPLTPRRDFGA